MVKIGALHMRVRALPIAIKDTDITVNTITISDAKAFNKELYHFPTPLMSSSIFAYLQDHKG